MADLVGKGRFLGQFIIEVDGLTIGQFAEVSGLEVEVGIELLSEGGENQFVHKLPGQMSWPNIRMRRGIIDSDNLFDWLSASSGNGYAGNSNKLQRKSAAITLLAPDGKRVRSWEVAEAFPVKWKGPSFEFGKLETASEELEIAHHGFRAAR